MSTAARRAEIERRLAQLQEQRAKEEALLMAMNNNSDADAILQPQQAALTDSSGTPNEIVSADAIRALARSAAPATSVSMFGETVSVGDTVSVITDVTAFRAAEVAMPRKSALKRVYLGEPGKVIAVFANYHGKPAAELQFADRNSFIFFAECLAVGERRERLAAKEAAQPSPAPQQGSTTAKVPASNSQRAATADARSRGDGDDDADSAAADEVKLPTALPKRPRVMPSARPQTDPSTASFLAELDILQLVGPDTPRTGTGSSSSPAAAASSIKAAGAPSAPPANGKAAPKDRMSAASAAQRHVDPNSSTPASASARGAAGRPATAAATRIGAAPAAAATPAKPARAAVAGAAATPSATPARGATAATRPATAGAAPPPPSIRKAPGTTPVVPAGASSSSIGGAGGGGGVVTLRVYENGSYGDLVGDRVPYRTVVLKPVHKALPSVLALVTQTLGWQAEGRKVDTLFNAATGAPVRTLAELQPTTLLVAAMGNDKFVKPRPNSQLHDALLGMAGAGSSSQRSSQPSTPTGAAPVASALPASSSAPPPARAGASAAPAKPASRGTAPSAPSASASTQRASGAMTGRSVGAVSAAASAPPLSSRKAPVVTGAATRPGGAATARGAAPGKRPTAAALLSEIRALESQLESV